MTEQEQRAAIATACGWTTTLENKYVHPKGERFKNLFVDPLNDLNAIAEAVATLNYYQFEFYSRALIIICREAEKGMWDHRRITEATAAQRAEAFLKAKGLWI